MMRRSFLQWAELEKLTGIKVFQRTGSIDMGPEDSPELKNLELSSKQYSITYSHLTAEQCAKIYPQFNLPKGHRAMFQDQGGVVFADKARAAFLSQCTGVFESKVARITLGAFRKHHLVETEDGQNFLTKKIVITAGAWTNEVLKAAGLSPLPLTTTNEQVTYYPPPEGLQNRYSVQHNTEDIAMPTFVYHYTGPKHKWGFYGIPQIPGGGPGVKVGVHLTGPTLENPSKRSQEPDLDMLALTDSLVEQFLPTLQKTSTNSPNRISVRCLYTCSPDQDFILGPHPEHDSIIVGCGFSGHGFKFAPAVGEILARYALDDPRVHVKDNELMSLLNVPQLSPNRFKD